LLQENLANPRSAIPSKFIPFDMQGYTVSDEPIHLYFFQYEIIFCPICDFSLSRHQYC